MQRKKLKKRDNSLALMAFERKPGGKWMHIDPVTNKKYPTHWYDPEALNFLLHNVKAGVTLYMFAPEDKK